MECMVHRDFSCWLTRVRDGVHCFSCGHGFMFSGMGLWWWCVWNMYNGHVLFSVSASAKFLMLRAITVRTRENRKIAMPPVAEHLQNVNRLLYTTARVIVVVLKRLHATSTMQNADAKSLHRRHPIINAITRST